MKALYENVGWKIQKRKEKKEWAILIQRKGGKMVIFEPDNWV
jgi:hypothetical protein